MPNKEFSRLKQHDSSLLHSDQSCQYQMPVYHRLLERRSLTMSMSHRGNCVNNAAMENFFGPLKSESFYLNKFRDLDQLQARLEDYIYYYKT